MDGGDSCTMMFMSLMPVNCTCKMRYHLTPVKMAFIKKKSANNKFCEDVERKETSCTVGGNVN